MAYWQVGGPTNKQNLRASPPLANELDHHSLVDDCGGMLDARGVLLPGLVQTTRELGALALFIQRCRGGGYRRLRVSDDACPDSRAIRSAPALDTCADVGAHRVGSRVRATLSSRWAALAGVDYLRPADSRVDSQFYFDAKS